MRDEFVLYHDFYVVAQNHIINKTSQKHFISQSTLTRNIQKLEDKLKTKLLIRHIKGIELTKDGIKLLNELQPVFSLLSKSDMLNSYVDNDLKSELIIGTTRNIADFYLVTTILNFRKKYPLIKIKIKIDHSRNLYNMLSNHDIDILLDYLPFNPTIEIKDVTVKSVGHFNTCFACSNEYYNQVENNIDLSKFDTYNYIVPGESRRRQVLDEFLQSNNLSMKPIIELPNSRLMTELVKAGLGIGYFLKDEIREQLSSGSFVEITLMEDLPKNSIGAIYYKQYNTELKEKFISNLSKNDELNIFQI